MYGLFPVLKERSDQRAGTLSGGEMQMLAIGRGLMSKPRLLILDEPSLGLSPKLVSMIFTVIGEINREGTTILLVEQNVRQALRFCQRGYVIENGKVKLSGPSSQLIDTELIRKTYMGI